MKLYEIFSFYQSLSEYVISTLQCCTLILECLFLCCIVGLFPGFSEPHIVTSLFLETTHSYFRATMGHTGPLPNLSELHRATSRPLRTTWATSGLPKTIQGHFRTSHGHTLPHSSLSGSHRTTFESHGAIFGLLRATSGHFRATQGVSGLYMPLLDRSGLFPGGLGATPGAIGIIHTPILYKGRVRLTLLKYMYI